MNSTTPSSGLSVPFRHQGSEIPGAVGSSRTTKRSGTPGLHGLLSISWCCGSSCPQLSFPGFASPSPAPWVPQGFLTDVVHRWWHWSSFCRLSFARPSLWRHSSAPDPPPSVWVAVTRWIACYQVNSMVWLRQGEHNMFFQSIYFILHLKRAFIKISSH